MQRTPSISGRGRNARGRGPTSRAGRRLIAIAGMAATTVLLPFLPTAAANAASICDDSPAGRLSCVQASLVDFAQTAMASPTTVSTASSVAAVEGLSTQCATAGDSSCQNLENAVASSLQSVAGIAKQCLGQTNPTCVTLGTFADQLALKAATLGELCATGENATCAASEDLTLREAASVQSMLLGCIDGMDGTGAICTAVEQNVLYAAAAALGVANRAEATVVDGLPDARTIEPAVVAVERYELNSLTSAQTDAATPEVDVAALIAQAAALDDTVGVLPSSAAELIFTTVTPPSLPEPNENLSAIAFVPDTATNKVDSAGGSGSSGSPCTLSTSNTYLRASSNYGAVGFKPTTSCYFAVTNIAMTSRLNKYHWWGCCSETQGPPYSTHNSYQSSLTNLKIALNCTDKKSTTWYGTTTGTVIIGSEKYTAQVRTDNATWGCGSD